MFRFLIKVLVFLVLVAIASAWYLLHADGKEMNWQNVARLPEVHLPRLRLPTAEDLRFWKVPPERPAGPPGAKWVARPGEEPQEYSPFVPGQGVERRFPPGTYFRWQDAAGTWHYAAEPEPGVRNYPVATDPGRNVLPAPKPQ